MTNAHVSDEQHSDPKNDKKIFIAVLLTTAVIITIGLMRLGTIGIILMVTLATIEVVVMAYNFMHLKTRRKTVHLLLILTIIVVVGLLFWPAWDILYSPRQHSDYILH